MIPRARFTKAQWDGVKGGATQTGARPVSLPHVSFDPKERAMAKRKAKAAKRKTSTDTRLAKLEAAMKQLDTRLAAVEDLGSPLSKRVVLLHRRIGRVEDYLGDDFKPATEGEPVDQPFTVDIPVGEGEQH